MISFLNTNYYIYGEILNENEESEYNLIIRRNFDSSTYSIIPNKYIGESELISLDIDNTDIILNNYNQYALSDYITDTQVILMYLEDYINLAMSNPEKAYEKLDSECKNKYFPNIDIYIKYVKEKYKDIKTINISTQYQVNNLKEYSEYICYDMNGNRYIFKEKNIGNYTIYIEV